MPEQLALFESLRAEPEGLRYAADFVSPESEQKFILAIRDLPLQPFQFGQFEGGVSLRSVFDTTTPCGNYSGPNRSQRGWTTSSLRLKRSAAPRPCAGGCRLRPQRAVPPGANDTPMAPKTKGKAANNPVWVSLPPRTTGNILPQLPRQPF